jgi:hypothetical protein
MGTGGPGTSDERDSAAERRAAEDAAVRWLLARTGGADARHVALLTRLWPDLDLARQFWRAQAAAPPRAGAQDGAAAAGA